MLADTTAAKTPEEIDQHDHGETEEHDGRHDVGDTFQARLIVTINLCCHFNPFGVNLNNFAR